MKKQYNNPEIRVIKINPSAIICQSVGFGSGSTNVMRARGHRGYIDDDDESYDE